MKYLYIFLIISVVGCLHKSDIQINTKEIQCIAIYKLNKQKRYLIKNIKDTTLIHKIITCINTSQLEVVKFIPNYILVLYKKDGTIEIAINESYLSMNKGIKYKMRHNIEDIITSL
jgi:hypothetical protein